MGKVGSCPRASVYFMKKFIFIFVVSGAFKLNKTLFKLHILSLKTQLLFYWLYFFDTFSAEATGALMPEAFTATLWFAQNQPQILDNCPHFCNRTENLRCFFLAKCTLPELCCRFFYFLVFQGGGPPLLTADEGLYSYVNPALINQPVLIIQPCIGVETAGTISAV